MPALVLDLLKYVFLIILYLFVARAVRAVYAELKPAEPAPSRPAPARSSKKSGKAPRRAAVVEGAIKGKTFDLGDELILGRGDKCHVVLDDTYASQVHARVFARDGTYFLEDLGSTNGTYLNKKRITSPIEVQRGDRVQIGKTILEMRK